MMKVFYLALTLIVLSTASMNAQVTIGSLDNPHPGAVLDLHSNAQGLLLPTVSLNDVSVFQLAADTARATGMTVYNTNPAIGAGLFIWDGKKWKQVGAGVSTGCSDIPDVPSGITLPATATVGEPFTASVAEDTGENAATSYIWSFPTSLSGSSTSRSIQLTASSAINIQTGEITVKAVNACGTQETAASNPIALPVCNGDCVTGTNGTYATYCYPNGVGCWMIENSKEGTYTYTTYPDHTAGERGYYYTWGNASSACPNGWALPTTAQWTTLIEYIDGADTAERKHWRLGPACAGFYSDDNGWMGWGAVGWYWANVSNATGYWTEATRRGDFPVPAGKLSVRCIKK